MAACGAIPKVLEFLSGRLFTPPIWGIPAKMGNIGQGRQECSIWLRHMHRLNVAIR